MFKQLVLSAALVCASASVAAAGNGTNLTKHVSESTVGMIVFDIKASRNAKLVKDGLNKLLDSQADARAKLADLGLDPLRDLDTVVFAFGGTDELQSMRDKGSMLIIVEGRIPKTVPAKLEANATKSTVHGVTVYTRDDTEATFLDGRLYFAKVGNIASTIELVKGKSKASLAASPKAKALRSAIAATNTKSHAWIALALPDKDKASAAGAQVPLESVGIALQLSNDIDAKIVMMAASPANAVTSFTTLDSAVPQMKQMLGQIGLVNAASSLTMKQDKSAIHATLKVSEAEIKTLMALAGMASVRKDPPATAPPPASPPPKSPGLGGKKP